MNLPKTYKTISPWEFLAAQDLGYLQNIDNVCITFQLDSKWILDTEGLFTESWSGSSGCSADMLTEGAQLERSWSISNANWS